MVTDAVRQASNSLKGKAGDLPLDRLLLSLALAIKNLVLSQNDDGGWGPVRDSQSEVLFTARVLQALGSVGIPFRHQVVNDGLSYLREAFLAEHDGWGRSIRSVTADEKDTAYALYGIAKSGQLDSFVQEVEKGVGLLLRRQIDDKGWFEGWGYKRASDTVTTAWAILALHETMPHEAKMHPALANAQGWLLSQSLRTGGGWRAESNLELPPDVIPTVLALRALACLDYRNGAIIEGLKYLVAISDPGGSWANPLGERRAHGTAETLVTLSILGIQQESDVPEIADCFKRGLRWLLDHRPLYLAETGWTAMVVEIGAALLPPMLETSHSLDRLSKEVADESAKAKGRGKGPICFKSKSRRCTEDLTLDPKNVFVAMPFDDKHRDAYYAIQNTLRKFGLEPLRADLKVGSTDLMCKVCRLIQSSGRAIVEISKLNPNVLFELGLCYGFGVQTVILKKGKSKVPSDLKGMEHIRYDYFGELAHKLEQYLLQDADAENRSA